jgi:hypothetical protein
MTAIRTDWFGADRAQPEDDGPEQYAPNRRTLEKVGDVDDAVSAFEGEIREFVRRDVTAQRRQRELAPNNETNAENVNALIQRVSGASMEEIDRVIAELRAMREMLRTEGERVSREISGYASLSHAAMTAMKVNGDSLAQWKSAPSQIDPRAVE